MNLMNFICDSNKEDILGKQLLLKRVIDNRNDQVMHDGYVEVQIIDYIKRSNEDFLIKTRIMSNYGDSKPGDIEWHNNYWASAWHCELQLNYK